MAGVEGAGESASPSDNVVLLTVDSLRADHCGFMGAEWETTPALDELAAEGVVFENAIATGPRTPSSMPVAFTGRFPEAADLEWGQWDQRYGRISSHLRRHRTLPERLRAAGFSTVGVTVNPWTHRTTFEKGFDRYVEITGEVLAEQGGLGSPLVSMLDTLFARTQFGQGHQWRFTKDWFVQWPHFYESILQAVEGVSEPYFLWVFLLDPHQPYLAPRRYRQENSALSMYLANYREMSGRESEGALSSPIRARLRRAYRDAVRSTDGFVDELLGDLEGDPTLIVHSDHGDALGEHGNWGHPSALYEENLHVPLLVHDGDQAGRIDGPVSLGRLPELITAVATATSWDPHAYSEEYVMAATEAGDRHALRGRRWKYIESAELYDLEDDPGESANLATDRADVLEEVRSILGQKRSHHGELTGIGRAVETVIGARL